jgi:anti-anti-sigma factor
MDLDLKRAGPAAVLRVEKGRLVVEEDTSELHDLVRALTTFDPGGGVVLDLGKVSQIDCSGIGQLMEVRRQVAERGGVFALVGVAARPRRLLDLLGLLPVLPLFASTEQAVTACWSAQARSGVPRPRPRPGEPPVLARSLAAAARRAAMET